jgi:hypothetical protein
MLHKFDRSQACRLEAAGGHEESNRAQSDEVGVNFPRYLAVPVVFNILRDLTQILLSLFICADRLNVDVDWGWRVATIFRCSSLGLP